MDRKLNEIDQEINSLHQQSSQQAELELHQNTLQDRERKVLTLQNQHREDLMLLLDSEEIPQKNLKESLDKLQKSWVNYFITLDKGRDQLLSDMIRICNE